MNKALKDMKERFNKVGVNLPTFIDRRVAEVDNATLLDTTCGANMTYTNCGGCETSCGEGLKICTKDCKPPGCYCNPGYVFDEHNNCILESDCPETTIEMVTLSHDVLEEGTKNCPTNFTYLECGTCDESCDGPGICTMECKTPGCYCVIDAAYDSNKNCILKKDCPNGDNDTIGKMTSDVENDQALKEMCKENEEWNSCGNICESSCGDIKVVCPAVCGPGKCTCVQGFVRNSEGVCISQDSCP